MIEIKSYAKHFSISGLWKKLAKYSAKLGRELLEKILILVYSLDDPNVPVKAKGVIVGALGYLILPLDLIPDMAPGGFTDDFGVIAAALAMVAAYVSPETVKKAKDRTASWFGEPEKA
ncbi:MAG: YkvA family protein [Trichloromonas sp.]|nr:YkvA family protein [Trichloromonas sp.]